MDFGSVAPLLDRLGSNIDDMEERLETLLQGSISETTSRLEVIDKAKLYVLLTYAIESILFCPWPVLSPFSLLKLD